MEMSTSCKSTIRRHNTLPGRIQLQRHNIRETEEFDVTKKIALINEVRKRPCLYDLDNDGYRDPMLRQQAWTTIAEKLNETVTQVKNDWKDCREYYVQLKLKKPQAENGPLVDYQNVMAFLRPNIAINKETLKLPMHIEMKTLSRPWTDKAWIRNYKWKKQRCLKTCPNSKYNTASNSISNEKPVADTDDKDIDIDLFFSSMCVTTKKLAKEFQNEIKKTLFEAVMAAEQRSQTQ